MKGPANVVALIQARMGSTRFPGKVLEDIASRPMLWHVINRVRAARSISRVVVTTSTSATDDPISAFCSAHDVECFRGSETDVLDRFYQAAKRYGAEVVVRVTADCPLLDPEVVDRVVETFLQDNCDYVANTLRSTYPDGLDVEAFSFESLERTWREARLPVEREHVTPYMRTSERFRLRNVENEVDVSARYSRWTVDEPPDLEFIRLIYAQLGGSLEPFTMREILRVLDSVKTLPMHGKQTIRNEGYYRSFAGERPLVAQDRRLERSRELELRAERVIPSCTQTFSKGRTQFVRGVAPVFLARGEGSHVWDVDGNEYIDYAMALGPVILGHNYPAVSDAVSQQMRGGTTFSLPHPLEVEVAEMLVEIIPCAEMVRFGKNGSDATAGAVRAARAYTGRDLVVCCGYHGWQDWFVGTTSRNRGVPKAVQELTATFAYNDLAGLERLFGAHPGQIAAVIMEPVGVVEPSDGFLEGVRELTRWQNALLIFDEVITGFRISLGGAQEYFGVLPDLACFGKGMANGYPLSAVVGRRDVMELFDDIFFSFTFGGETLSLAACAATIREFRRHDVVDYLWARGQKLRDGFNVLSREFGIGGQVQCIGLPPRTMVNFTASEDSESLLLKSLFQQECLKRGVLFSGSHNICFSHTDGDIEYTLRVYRSAMEVLRDAISRGDVAARLEGEPVRPVFRQP